MGKKTKIIVVVVLLFLFVSPIIGYFMAKASEPFQYSTKVIKNSVPVKEELGDVKVIKLAPFGYSVRFSGPKGWAEFETEVIGTKGSGTLNIKLEKNLGTWEIVAAKLNEHQITL